MKERRRWRHAIYFDNDKTSPQAEFVRFFLHVCSIWESANNRLMLRNMLHDALRHITHITFPARVLCRLDRFLIELRHADDDSHVSKISSRKKSTWNNELESLSSNDDLEIARAYVCFCCRLRSSLLISELVFYKQQDSVYNKLKCS